jgi:CheY-like chemotaxis protein
MANNSGSDTGCFSPQVSASQTDVGAQRSPLRILIVDDLVDAADGLALLLRRLGYEVQATYDGASALRVATKFVPQAVLLDLALPKLDGFQIAARLRQVTTLQNVCLIALSGYGEPDDRARTRGAGFDFHLLKPVNFEELLQLLDACAD